MRITCEVRASLAGISALPKAHLAHVLLPRCKDMKILNNNICPKENDLPVPCAIRMRIRRRGCCGGKF